MKHNISKRLIFTNLTILFIALSTFFLITTAYFNQQLKSSADLQLRAESVSILKQFTFQGDYNTVISVVEQTNLEQGIHIFCSDPVGDNNLQILKITDTIQNLIIQDGDFVRKIEALPNEVTTSLMIGDDKYTAVSISYKDFMNENAVSVGKTEWDVGENEEIVLVSLIPLSTVSMLLSEYFFIFMCILLFITFLSYFMMRRQSKKITVPLSRLSKVANEYTNRNFSNTLSVNTGDEIELLSNTISTMVDELTSFEKSQSTLFRNLSHELKTPLAAINGYSEAILDGHYEDITPPLKIISEESMRIKNILDDLIFLSKMDSNTEQFYFEEKDIIKILTASIEKIESIAILNDIDIIYNPQCSIMLSCDETKIVRMFINILSNALKFAEHSIKIEIIRLDRQTHIEITDDGSGFDKEVLKNFLIRGERETLTGNGLGLLIVNEIATHHGFKVYVENTDKGAKVTIEIKD